MRRHVVITGTGRAGTTFLVQFLEACGLDVGTGSERTDRSRAGLEHSLLDPDAPYVVKDPFLSTYCDDIDPARVDVEALIVPVRELMAAAESRVLQERISLAESPWRQRSPVDVRGMVAGGVVYSLDPVDQARLLAVGFHRLIRWATVRKIPLFLLDFPRLVEEEEYLIDTLWPWLATKCTRQDAAKAFELVADASLLRVRALSDDDPTVVVTEADERDPLAATRLDRDALAVLVAELESELESVRASTDQAHRDFDKMADHAAELQRHLGDERLGRELDREAGEDARSVAARELAEVQHALEAARLRLQATERHLAQVQAEYVSVRRTVSWRMTRPVRALGSVGRRWRRTSGTESGAQANPPAPPSE